MKTKNKNELIAIAMLLMLFVIVMPAMVEKASASGALGGIWRFDEGTGTTAYDSSGNGNHGTVHGAIWTDGKIGKALEFDGVNDYVNMPDSNSLDITGKITLEAWIYPYTVTTMQVIVQKYNYSGPPYNGAYYLGVGGYGYNNKILFGLSHNGYNFYYILSNTNIAANTWTHVAATSNGTHMIIYINGIKDKVATYPPGVIYASAAPLRIGCFLPELGVSRFFNGLIDEVRVSSGTIWTVDDDRVQCPNADFTSIQAAINKASPDDTIIIHDGTYDEQVIINKSLTVQGTGSTPVIKPSSAAQLTTILDGRYWGGTKQIAGIIIANVADGSNVTVKNLVVDGENVITKPTGADYVAGIFYRETGGLIDALTIANMTIDVSGTAVRGYGIYLSAIVNTVSVEVKDCNITNYDKNGVNAHGDKLTVNIHDNTIAGRGPLPAGDEVQNGIVIMDSAIATVNSNTISNMAYMPETWWSAGILFLDGGNDCSANYNTINDCQIGIIFNDMSGSATGNTVNGGAEGKAGLVLQQSWGTGTWTASFVGNIVSGCDTEGIGVHSYDADTSITATVDNNQLNGGLGDGIFIGDIPDYSPAGNITVIITNNNVSNWRLGIRLASSVIGATITGNRITDFIKGGIVTRSAKNIFIKGNTISTTLHDEAPNGIDVGTYSGTTGTIRENEISGCSWNGFTGDYEASWSGSGILVIESADSLQILANIVHDCDVGMDIESDLTNITCNDVHNNIYGFIFWNANPKVNYDNIYSNTKYGVCRTTLGNLTGALDARYNWWGDATGPYHPTLNPTGLGNAVSDYVSFSPWLFAVKVPPLVHDVAITDVTPSAFSVIVGTTIHINVTAKNEGTAYENFTVTLSYDSNIIGVQTINDLVPGVTRLLTFNWDTSGMPSGNYTLKAEASTVPGETNTTNNVFIDGTVEIYAFVHDVAVTNVTTFKTLCTYTLTPFDVVYQNYSVSINATVENLGDFAETFNVTAKYDSNMIQTQTVSLAAHTSTYVTFTWDTHGVAKGNYNITVTADLAGDANPGDNTKTYGPIKVTWLGDSNGDFVVDENDLWDFCSHFITYYTPGKGYMPRSICYDFNENCQIDENDLWTFCAVFINYYKST